MRDAIAALVRDGDSVAIEGFTHLICFAAGHEIIRQRRRDLTLIRMTPDVIYDQMIGAGVARKLVFSWLGNPGVGSLHAIRRVTEGPAASLELEEYSHYGMVGRYIAGATNLPFYPLRSYYETDLPVANPLIRPLASPYGDDEVYVVPPLHPDVTIVHAQRADAAGDTQMWGLLGAQKEAAFAADRVIVVVEELVDAVVIRADPNRTIIPGLIVDAVVVEPYGAHPSYVQGALRPRQRLLRRSGTPSAGTRRRLTAWLDDWVHGLDGRAAYMERLGETVRARIRPTGTGAGRCRSTTARTGEAAWSRRRAAWASRSTSTSPARMSGGAWSASEMMIVAAARELAGQRVCFVGIGLPNIAVNLARHTVAPDSSSSTRPARTGRSRRACRSRSAIPPSSAAPSR